MRPFTLRPGYGLGGELRLTLPPSSRSSVTAAPLSSEPDEAWMQVAIQTAMAGVGLSSPNPTVGAVLVDPSTQKEIARGHTQVYKKEHAERMAIEAAKNSGCRVEGSTLYVTLEPCSHQGYQPPCADLVVKHRIARVVIGSRDPDPRVSGEGIQKLIQAGIEVRVGVLEAECQAWHYPFLRTRFETRSPSKKILWIAKWAETRTGALADAEGNSKWISHAHSRAYAHWLRQKYDAIVVGAETFLRDRPLLTVRDCAEPHHRHPHRFVLDRSGRIPDELLRDSASEVRPWHRVRDLEQIESFGEKLLLQSVMVEGGPRLLDALFEADVFEVAHVFTSGLSREFGAGARHLRRVPFQVQAQPSSWNRGWFCVGNQQIADDHLREWVKFH